MANRIYFRDYSYMKQMNLCGAGLKLTTDLDGEAETDAVI